MINPQHGSTGTTRALACVACVRAGGQCVCVCVGGTRTAPASTGKAASNEFKAEARLCSGQSRGLRLYRLMWVAWRVCVCGGGFHCTFLANDDHPTQSLCTSWSDPEYLSSRFDLSIDRAATLQEVQGGEPVRSLTRIACLSWRTAAHSKKSATASRKHCNVACPTYVKSHLRGSV